jgi:acyl-CoA dehydrogenase
VAMLLLGGALKRKERISARLGDVLSQLYIGSTVLKYFQDNKQPDSDLDNVRWSIQNCLYQIQIAFDELTDNFPIRWVAKLIYALIFPWGRAYKKPSDKLGLIISAAMVAPSEFRDRLTRHCFMSDDPEDAINRLERTFLQRVQLEPLFKKFRNLVRNKTIPAHYRFSESIKMALKAGGITKEEADTLQAFNDLEKEVVKVDEFSKDFSEVLTKKG